MSEPQRMGRQWDIRFLWKSGIARGVWATLALCAIALSFRLILDGLGKRPLATVLLAALFLFAIYFVVSRVRRKWNEIVKPQ